MYHVAKVLEVFKAEDEDIVAGDGSVQAQLEVWDDNKVTALVHPGIGSKIKVKDTVLVRFANPEPTVMKIVKGKRASKLWDDYKSFLAERESKRQKQSMMRMPPGPIGPMEGMIR